MDNQDEPGTNVGLADCGPQLYADDLHYVEEVVARKEMPLPILMYALFYYYLGSKSTIY